MATVPSLLSVLKANKSRYWDGIVAIILINLSQLLISLLQLVTRHMDRFPAAIIAMLLVAVLFILLSTVVQGVDGLYEKHLRRPTDLLNKHMSIGFIVPFIMIMKAPVPAAKNAGLIISGFVVTGILNTAFVYVFAFGLQTALMRVTKPGRPAEKPRQKSADHSILSCSSEATTMANNYNSDMEAARIISASQQQRSDRHCDTRRSGAMAQYLCRLICVFLENPVICGSLWGVVFIGLPIALATGKGAALDTFVLFFVWTSTLSAQAAIKKVECLHRFPRWRIVFATSLNPVLWSSALMMAYMASKASIEQAALATVLDRFSTGTTLADLIHNASSPNVTMGAGDIAMSILNAGIVTWGLKMFEYRSQLLSWAGITTLLTGAVFAVLNIVCGPLLVHAMGLTPASHALAFAARSVTIALAGPAMDSLGGDVGLNAAMVVFNGIAFQVIMGLGFGRWMNRLLAQIRHSRPSSPVNAALCQYNLSKDSKGALSPEGAASTSSGNTVVDVEKTAGVSIVAQSPVAPLGLPHESTTQDDVSEDGQDSPGTVAAGMTVGINAAAMGTAYLYEDGSRAAPYSALAMTIFGVMTVVFTSIQALDAWLVSFMS